MKRAILYLTVALVVFLAFVFTITVWPTPWRYDHVGNTMYRTNRFTGEVQILTKSGWGAYRPIYGF